MQPGDALKGRKLYRGGLIALAFAILGACLLLSARGIRVSGGALRERLELPGGTGTLYVPAEAVGGETVADEDGHVFTAGPGGALILAGTLDGSDALATELARRGVTVLLADRGTSAADGWDWLFTHAGAELAVLISSYDRAGEAMALGQEKAGSPDPCAALILLADREAVLTAGDYTGQNLLLLTDCSLSEGERTAFFGSRADAELGFSGYFGEGTARALEYGPLFCTFADRGVMSRVIDWQGSCLGHPIELSDGDHIYGSILFCRAAAICCFLLAAGACGLTVRAGLKRRGTDEKEKKK